MWSFIICSPYQITFGLSNEGELDGRDKRNLCGRREIHTAFWWENLKKIINLEDLHIGMRMILKWILKKQNGRA